MLCYVLHYATVGHLHTNFPVGPRRDQLLPTIAVLVTGLPEAALRGRKSRRLLLGPGSDPPPPLLPVLHPTSPPVEATTSRFALESDTPIPLNVLRAPPRYALMARNCLQNTRMCPITLLVVVTTPRRSLNRSPRP